MPTIDFLRCYKSGKEEVANGKDIKVFNGKEVGVLCSFICKHFFSVPLFSSNINPKVMYRM